MLCSLSSNKKGITVIKTLLFAALLYMGPPSSSGVDALATNKNSQQQVPKLVAFDLDGTIWSPDMYMLWGGGSPFRFVSNEELRDSRNSKVKLLGISGAILDDIATEEKWEGTKVAWVSCTDEPSWADECMEKFRTPMGVPLVDRVQEQCIYKANKQSHFRDLQERTGIAFDDMIFFDNEGGNIDSVERIGVCSVYCPNGMTKKIWESGLASWSQRRQQGK